MMQCPEYLRIAVNEAFTPLSAIKKLCSMDLDEPESAVFFNFTLLPPGVSYACVCVCVCVSVGGQSGVFVCVRVHNIYCIRH